ncbi:MAG: TonB-dependent receptor [Rhodospirillaceae bacterium]|nr:TonB-dependent receptor [Rhodospirillaceae bacterium]
MSHPQSSRIAAVRRSALLTTSLLFLGIPASTASAQDSGPTQAAQAPALEEIIVTSRKREESLIEVPLSVVVLTAAEIQKAQIFDMRDITKVAPGAFITNIGGNGQGRYIPLIAFRGLTPSNSLPRIQTGAVFIDGIYVLGGVNSVNTVDVQRVEVLKGPQNAYFGRNTFGGAINFITRVPGNEFQSEVNVLASTRGSYDVNLSVEGPLIEGKLAGRLTVLQHQKGSHYTANDGGELGEETTQSASATLYATPTDSFWLRLRAHVQQDDDTHGPLAHISGPIYGGNSCAGRQFNGRTLVDKQPVQFALSIPYICGKIPSMKQIGEKRIVSVNTSFASPRLASVGNPNGLFDAFVRNSLGDPLMAAAPKLDHFGLLRNTVRLTAQGQFEFDNGIIVAFNAGYDDTETQAFSDGDRSDEENIYGAQPALSETKHAEIRLQSAQDQKFRWMVGATWYDGEFLSSYGGGGSVLYQVRTAPTLPIARAPVLAQPILAPGAVPSTNGELAKVYAGFGSVAYDLTDWLSLEGEIRRQQDKSRLTASQSVTGNFKDWLPRVIANFKPQDDWTVYASWSRGVLPGSFNSQYFTANAFHRGLIEAAFPGVQNIADSDRLDNYEIGSKQRLFDGQFQYTLALYKMKWKNLKSTAAFVVPTVPAGTPLPPGAAPTITFTGIIVPGDAKMHGGEFEGTWAPNENWDVNLRASYTTGKYTNFIQPFLAQLTSNVTRFDGNKLARVPNWNGAGSVSYQDRLTGEWDWFARSDVTYTGKAWDSEANIVRTSDFFRVNLRIGVERDNFSLEAYSTNLFDNRTWDYGFRNVFQGSPGSIFQALPTGFGFPAFGFPQGVLVGVPDKRDFGMRMKYSF